MTTHRKSELAIPAVAGQVLHVRVGESLAVAGERAVQAMQALQAGRQPVPYFGIGFGSVGQMLGVFTRKRWELIAALRSAGPLTVAELARTLKRDYKNVHSDVAHLAEWMAVERAEDGRVSVPWSEIVVDMKLPQQKAA